MALDLTKPLRRKDTGRPVVLLENVGELSYAVKHGGQWEVRYVAEEIASDYLENVPERRTLDCWAAVLTTPHANGYMGSLWTDKSAAKETVLGVQQHECHIHINRDYEVGEGLE